MKLKKPSKTSCKVAIPSDDDLQYILQNPKLWKNKLGLYAGGIEIYFSDTKDSDLNDSKTSMMEY